jgi:hypothetical protein
MLPAAPAHGITRTQLHDLWQRLSRYGVEFETFRKALRRRGVETAAQLTEAQADELIARMDEVYAEAFRSSLGSESPSESAPVAPEPASGEGLADAILDTMAPRGAAASPPVAGGDPAAVGFEILGGVVKPDKAPGRGRKRNGVTSE